MKKITKQNIVEKYYKYNNLIPDDYCTNIADFVSEYYDKFVKLEMIEILWYLLEQKQRLFYNHLLVENMPTLKFNVEILDIPKNEEQNLRLDIMLEKLKALKYGQFDYIHVTQEFLDSWKHYFALTNVMGAEYEMSLKYEFIFKHLIKLLG